jgi:fibronectin-binding autotransporter adhesin
VINPTAPALQVDAGVVNLNGTSASNPDSPTANLGNVVVNATGVLNVNGSISGNVTVNAGGKLGGTGTVGATTINSAPGLPGILSPGLSAGTLSTGSLSLTSDARYEFELGDLVNVTGDLTLDGVLAVNVGGLSDGTYRLINYTGNLTDNGLTLDPAFLFLFPGSSISTAPNQVNLVVIPEPGAFAALLGGMGLLAGLRRYRRS